MKVVAGEVGGMMTSAAVGALGTSARTLVVAMERSLGATQMRRLG